MHEGTDPLYELRVLRKALQLLIDVEQFSLEDERIIALQTRNVLHTGYRQPICDADCPPLAFDLDDEILKSHNDSCED